MVYKRSCPMKTLYSALVVVGLVALVGCNTSPPGGNTNPTDKAAKADTFKLKGPEKMTAHTVKHNSTETYKVTVDKGKEFKEDIALSAMVNPPDKGVKAEVDPATWKASGPSDVSVKVIADDKAPAGNYKVTVTGKPTTGAPTSVDFDVKVPEKK